MARRRRLFRRALPLALLAGAAFVVGALSASGSGNQAAKLARSYAQLWARGDPLAMYDLLAPASRRRLSLARFLRALRADERTATLTHMRLGAVGSMRGRYVRVRMLVSTRVWGELTETLLVPVSAEGDTTTIDFSPVLLFPGLRPGERLTRSMSLPPRAALLASDGSALAEGPALAAADPAVADQVAGRLGPIPPAQAHPYEELGLPPSAQVGQDGLERIFQSQLAGRPGGRLMAGRRVLASSRPRAASAVRTTIDPTLERAAIGAAAGHYSALAAMDPRTGAILALTGFAFSAVQPPGSTMKIITSTGLLQYGLATLDERFPVATGATIDGYTLQNDDGEACGGTLLNAFAVSCNSVFAPLGVQLGARRLVALAERFGFDQPSAIPGAAESTIPPPARIGDAVAVGSSAIGQGKVQASILEMTDVAAAIAEGGRRPVPTLTLGARPRFVTVTTPQVAAEVRRMMVAVVTEGTGTAAAIPGVSVAGKTGTAELRDTARPRGAAGSAPPNNASETDAWFVAFAPAAAPTVVVGALFPAQGAGGQTAAPAVRQVLVAALPGAATG